MPARSRMAAFAAAALLLLASNAPARAEQGDAGHLVLGVGAYDMGAFGGRHDTAAGFGVEYRFGGGFFFLRPMLGLMGTSDGGVYGYGGILADIDLLKPLHVIPSVAIGGFDAGGGKDLGHVFEIRSGVEVAWEFENAMRLGVMFHHISNAAIGDSNPGAESVFLNFTVPVDSLLR